MSANDLATALQLIAENPGRGFFAGPRSADLIAVAEDALGGRLPANYRKFISRLGAGNFGSFEVYGLVDGEFEDSAVPNGIWLTLVERREKYIPGELVVIADAGMGDYYCIELRNGGESPVIIYRPGIPSNFQPKEVVAEDFGEFLLKQISEQL